MADGKVDSYQVFDFHVGSSRYKVDAVRIALAVLVLLLAAMVAHAALRLGGSRLDSLFVKWIYNVVLIGSAASCLARAASVERERSAWLVLGVALLTWAGGNIYFTVALFDAKQVPIPSWSDAGYLSIYPGAYAALVLMLRSRVSEFRASIWLDGLIGALAVGSIGAAVLLKVVLAAIGGDPVSVGIALAYPLLDLLLVAFVVAVGGLSGWKLDRTLLFVAAGFVVFGMSDGFYVYQNTIGTYHPGSVFDMGWPVAIVLLALAAWQPPARVRSIALDSWRMLIVPSAFALLALGVLVYGAAIGDVGLFAISLATASLLAVIVRLAITFRENMRMLRASQWEALTDALTRLGNRRRLSLDLEQALGSAVEEPRILVLFDLNGFKSYNDTFGHPAGDALLERLGRQLDASAARAGRAYRMGGDEFCVLAKLGAQHPEAMIAEWALALSDQGEGFSITCSYGWCRLPDDAAGSSAALRVADQAMYRNKQRSPSSPARQSMDVLVAALQQRDGALGSHGRGVAHLAERVAQQLGLPDEEIELIRQGAELHDIGKVAIPDAILNKPGPLDGDEWAFIRRHTLIGESIIAAAPALIPVAKLVRSTHERVDGSGYPDALKGPDIPIGSRIIAVCDAFDAMTSDRSYSRRMTVGAALAELERCAGTQFDPDVLDAFMSLVEIVPGPNEQTPIKSYRATGGFPDANALTRHRRHTGSLPSRGVNR